MSGVIQSVKRKAIRLLGGEPFDIDQASADLGISLVMGHGLTAERLEKLATGLKAADFAEKSNQFVTATAAPWMKLSESTDPQFNQEKTKRFHRNYEHLARTLNIHEGMKAEIKELEKLPVAVAVAPGLQDMEALEAPASRRVLSPKEAYRLRFLKRQLPRVGHNLSQKIQAMETDSMHMLGFSWKPVEDRPVITKVPVILTKGETIIQSTDGLTKNVLGKQT